MSHLYIWCGKAKKKQLRFSPFLSLLSLSFLPYRVKGLLFIKILVIFSWNAKIGWNLDLGCVYFVEKLRSFYSIWGFCLWETAMPALVNYRGESFPILIISLFYDFLMLIVNMVNTFCSCVLDLVCWLIACPMFLLNFHLLGLNLFMGFFPFRLEINCM